MALALVLVACGVVNVAPPGSRQWRITVENQSRAPARLFIAEDEMPMGATVGTVVPNTVPAGDTQEVVFTVPPGEDWAIFVNPSPAYGALIGARDVPPDAAGELPIGIVVNADGAPMSTSDGGLGPGWFGQ